MKLWSCNELFDSIHAHDVVEREEGPEPPDVAVEQPVGDRISAPINYPSITHPCRNSYGKGRFHVLFISPGAIRSIIHQLSEAPDTACFS